MIQYGSRWIAARRHARPHPDERGAHGHHADCLADRANLTLVGTGGTTTILARMEKQMSGFQREEIEGTVLSRTRIGHWMEKLWSLSVAQRREIAGVPGGRADIVPMGAAIYEAVMDQFGFGEVFVSTRGLRFGALMPQNE